MWYPASLKCRLLGAELLKQWGRKLGRVRSCLPGRLAYTAERELCHCESSVLTGHERFLSAQRGAGMEVKKKWEKGHARTQDCDSSCTQ